MAPPEIPLHSHEFLFADKELNNEHLASVSLSFPLCLRSPTGTAETNLPTGRSNLSTIFIHDNRFLVQSPNSEASGFLGNYHSKTRGISSASSKVRCEFFFFFSFLLLENLGILPLSWKERHNFSRQAEDRSSPVPRTRLLANSELTPMIEN